MSYTTAGPKIMTLHMYPPAYRQFARVEYRRFRRCERLTRADARMMVLGRLVGLFDAMPVTAVFA